MKKVIFLFALFLSLTLSAETMRVAILETVDKQGDISYATKLMLRSNLSKAVTNNEGYEAYDRTDMDAIMGEQNFQRTGMVSADQIKRLGEMTGANYILVAEAVKVDEQNIYVTAKILEVETARTILTDNSLMGTTAQSIQDGCVALTKKMFGNTTSMPNKDAAKKMVENRPTTAVAATYNAPMIVRNSKADRKLFGKEEYEYNGMSMDDKAMQDFLKNNCPEAYKKMMSGQLCKIAGWGLFGAGIGMLTGGTALLIASDYFLETYYNKTSSHYQDKTYFQYYQYLEDSGIGFVSVGASTVVISIIPLAVGYHRYNNAYEEFNERCASKITLSLNCSNNGLGLALSF